MDFGIAECQFRPVSSPQFCSLFYYRAIALEGITRLACGINWKRLVSREWSVPSRDGMKVIGTSRGEQPVMSAVRLLHRQPPCCHVSNDGYRHEEAEMLR